MPTDTTSAHQLDMVVREIHDNRQVATDISGLRKMKIIRLQAFADVLGMLGYFGVSKLATMAVLELQDLEKLENDDADCP